jgi:hypothetical protein
MSLRGDALLPKQSPITIRRLLRAKYKSALATLAPHASAGVTENEEEDY